jgi:hypothetical protein
MMQETTRRLGETEARLLQAGFEMQDRCGFAAGDVSLHRYVGNNPTNRTDPTGLVWQYEIGEHRGPATANAEGTFPKVWIPVMGAAEGVGFPPFEEKQHPVVRYYQVRGGALDIGAGIWGQPRNTASGVGNPLKSGDPDLTGTHIKSAYGGAESIVTVKGTGKRGGIVIPSWTLTPPKERSMRAN